MKQEPTNIKLDIPRFIFWIDKNIKTEENQNYLKELQKEFPSYKKETFDSIENLEYFLKKEKKEYDFKFIYIIISGSLAEKFFNSYNIFDYTTIIAATIVFCGNKSFHSSKPYANDLYLNPGGVVNNFDEVIEYIKNPNDILWHNLISIKENNIILPKNKGGFGYTFKYANDLSDITLPIILTEIIKKNLIQDIDILRFKDFVFSRYLKNKNNNIIIPLAKPSLEKSVYIPFKKRAKFLLRLYTLETDFYRDLNKELTNLDGFGPYKVLILIFYFSIQNKSLKSYVKNKLYRRTLISKNEFDEIIKIFEMKKNNINTENKVSSILYYSKPFMSFSKDYSKTLAFANIIHPNTVRVTFILNPPKYDNKIFFSNIDIDELKLNKYDEEEVLFLPLSCFEVENYEKIGENDYKIYLNYLDKYYEQLKKEISSMKNEEIMQSFFEKVLESPYSEKVIDCFEDYKNVLNNIKEFFLENSSIPDLNLNNLIIPKLPHNNLTPIYELKFADGNKALIKQNPKNGNFVIIKKIDENGNLGYQLKWYDEAIKPFSEEIKVGNTNNKEVLINIKDLYAAKIKELSLLRNGYASANLIGGAIGYNLANIDNFIKSSNADKAKTLGATFGLSTGMIVLSNTVKSAVPIVSTSLLGGFYIYDLASDINNQALTKKETAISILKNTANLAVNLGTGIGGFYAGLQIGVSLGITTGPGAILIGIGSGIIGGLLGGLFGRFLSSTKMVLNCNSFYKNYIPLKFREEGNIPDLFWEQINKNTKSLALELIIDQKYKTWSVINIPPQTRKIDKNVGETLIKYGQFRHYNPGTVDFMLYSLKKEKITKEEWNDQNKNKELIIDVAILEVYNL